MEIFSIDTSSWLGIFASIVPLAIWGYFLVLVSFTPLEKIFKALKDKSFSRFKILLIASFFVSGPVLIILGVVILIVRYQKLPPSKKALFQNEFKVLQEKAMALKEGAQNIETSDLDKKLPDFLKEKTTKPSAKSMNAAISGPTMKNDHGIGRAIILGIMILVLVVGYWIWKQAA